MTMRLSLSVVLLVLSFSSSLYAWNDLGHKVVAQIAWNELDSTTKQAIIDVLKTAPTNSRMIRGLPANPGSWPTNINDARYERLFQLIATWPDFVRGDPNYHHGVWHFTTLFWQASDQAIILMPSDQEPGLLTEKIQEFSRAGSAENGAVQIAWLVHLVGDVHQPLHCGSRVTDIPREQDGDRGGNEFCLASARRCKKTNLHSYWDGTLSREYGNTATVSQIATRISESHPQSQFASLGSAIDNWKDEGLAKILANAYPSSLRRGVTPSANYGRNTIRVVKPSIALAGYRLADLLRARFVTD